MGDHALGDMEGKKSSSWKIEVFHPARVAATAKGFRRVCAASKPPGDSSGADQLVSPRVWVPPDLGRLKINVDGGLDAERGNWSVGFICRNSESRIVGTLCRRFSGHLHSEEVEVVSVRETLSWAKGKKWTKVEFESDYLRVVDHVRQGKHTKNIFGCIIYDCRHILLAPGLHFS